MKVALIGYSQSGRSTLYRAAANGLAKGEISAVPVPDPRFDAIVAQVKPKKITPATVILHDDVDPIAGTGKPFSTKLLDQAKKADLILHVVRAFDNPMSPFFSEVNPIRDAENVEVELVLSDLAIVETRLEKLRKAHGAKAPGSVEYLELRVFERVAPELENGIPLRALELDEDEVNLLKNYQFLSIKPSVIAFNVEESEVATPPAAIVESIAKFGANGTPAFTVCAKIEEELAELDEADRSEFLSSLGLTESAGNKVIRAVYDALGLITFFTAGENDTRAWPLRQGSSALKAAATIHNDIAKGFIRAEVVHYADYANCGSLDAAYSAGKMSLEGKDYVVKDGDLLHIRNKS